MGVLGGKIKATSPDAVSLTKGITVDDPEVPVEVSNIYKTLLEEAKNNGFMLPSAYSFPNARAPWEWSILEWSTGDPNTFGGARSLSL